MSLKHKLIEHWHRFLQQNFNSYLRNAPLIGKERKYQHVDIQNQFSVIEQERREQRLRLIEHKQQLRKKVLQKELNLMQEIDIISDGRQFSVTQNMDLNEDSFREIRETITQTNGKREVVTKQLAEVEAQLKQIQAERQELTLVQQQIVELEPDMMIVMGTQKRIVLNMLHYYEFQQRHLTGLFLNPETKKNIEFVHYRVQNNLPVKRELLYEVLPELFEKEINELETYRRKLLLEKRPQFTSDHSTILGVVEKMKITPEKLDFYEMLQHQEMEMSDFVLKHASMFNWKWDSYIEMKHSQGIPSVDEIFDQLVVKEHLTEEEKLILAEYRGLEKILKDYLQLMELNKVRVVQHQKTLQIPEFVKQNEVLLKAWTDKWEQLIKNSYDFSESRLVPETSYESKLDKAISEFREADIKELIDQCKKCLMEQQANAEFKEQSDVPIRDTRDRKQKDLKLVRKMQVMTGVMHTIKPDERKLLTMPRRKGADEENLLPEDRGEEQRIHLNELPKILFMNNQDPQKVAEQQLYVQYNIQFWAKHFNIEPSKLRNIFNYISYPIVTGDGKQETSRVLRFITFSE